MEGKTKSRKKRKKRKGQFFIWGAFIICLMFFIGLSGLSEVTVISKAEDLNFYYKNLEAEFPRALNLGLNQSAGIDKLKNFTRFVDGELQERMIDFQALWLISEKSGSGVNVTVGNFLEENKTIVLNQSGTVKNLLVSDNSTNSTIFDPVNGQFNLTVDFGLESQLLEWFRDKTNLYLYMNLSRGDSFVKGETEA